VDDQGSIPGRGSDDSLPHRVQTDSGGHLAYVMGTGDSYPGDKADRAWSWPFTSIQCRCWEWVELYLRSQYVFMTRCLEIRLHGVVLI